MKELLSARTRDLIAQISPSDVQEASAALRWAGFQPIEYRGIATSTGGVFYSSPPSGKKTVEQTFARVNFADPDAVARALRYTARAARIYAAKKDADQSKLVKLEYALADDGFSVEAAGDPIGVISALAATASSALPDAAAIRLELTRIERALPDDPSAAVGKAKNLVEATAKAILALKGQGPTSENPNLTALARQAAEALGVHPTQAEGPHLDQVRKLLGRLLSVAQDIAELRNQAGDGHGMTEVPAVNAAAARLTVRAAAAWCAFMLEVAQGGRAPSR